MNRTKQQGETELGETAHREVASPGPTRNRAAPEFDESGRCIGAKRGGLWGVFRRPGPPRRAPGVPTIGALF
jgi:hypothetical protein